jgi:hypothetical protein
VGIIFSIIFDINCNRYIKTHLRDISSIPVVIQLKSGSNETIRGFRGGDGGKNLEKPPLLIFPPNFFQKYVFTENLPLRKFYGQ